MTRSKNANYWLNIISLGMVLGLSIRYVNAWNDPTGTPPLLSITVNPILDTATEQTKNAPLGVTNNLKIIDTAPEAGGNYRKVAAPVASGSGQGSDFDFASQNSVWSQLVLWNNGTTSSDQFKFGTVMGMRESLTPPVTYFGIRNHEDDYFIASQNDNGYKFNQLATLNTDTRSGAADTFKKRYRGVLSYNWNLSLDNNGSVINKPMLNIGEDISNSNQINSNVMLDVKGAIRTVGASQWNIYNTPSDQANPKGEVIIGSHFLASGWGSGRDKWLFLGDSTPNSGKSVGIRNSGPASSRLTNLTGLSTDLFHTALAAVFNNTVYIGDPWDPFRPAVSAVVNHPGDSSFNIPFSDQFPPSDANVAKRGVKLQVSSGAIDAKAGLLLELRGATKPGTSPTCTDSSDFTTCTDPGLVNGRIWLTSDTMGAGAGSGREVDKIGTLDPGKWCTSNGSVINCTSDTPLLTEVDPKVDSSNLRAGRYCTSDGSVIQCTTQGSGVDTLLLNTTSDGNIFYSDRHSGNARYWEPPITYNYYFDSIGTPVVVRQISIDMMITAEDVGGSGGRDSSAEFYYQFRVNGTTYRSGTISGIWGHDWSRMAITLPAAVTVSGPISITFNMMHGDDDIVYTFYAKDILVDSYLLGNAVPPT